MNNLKITLIKFKMVVLIFFAVGLITGIITSCFSNDAQSDTNGSTKETVSSVMEKRPMIIWFQDIETGPEALDLAISSGLFSHVLLEGVNYLDRQNYYTVPKFRQSLEVLRKHKDVKIIWCRWLYPGHKLDNFKFEDAFDANYYVRQIRRIREEAKLMGADFVAFDVEPYVKCPLLALPNRRIPEAKSNAIRDAIRTAVQSEGKVDFVLPAPFICQASLKHLYEATSEIGEDAIAEHTYRDVPKMRNDKRRPYDIFGAFVSVTKTDPNNPDTPFFTPREILERQELWSHKKGLLIFTGLYDNSISVAREFSKIGSVRPVKD
ncbi:MAG: hypothetical protein JXB29_01580 [Sedimentisphaerales bacterium]|nr:hypothetical protein [Sedimentisphaerales bacterium]